MPRVHSIDYLRGLMAFSVLLYHFQSWTIGGADSGTIMGRLGIYAVSTFFVISGMSLFIAYKDEKWNARSTIFFAAKRFLRLAPAFWVACILMVIVLCLTDDTYTVRWKQIIYNLTLTFGFIKPEAYITVGGWSIGNEVVFYALLPFILWSHKKISLLLSAAAALAIAAHFYYAFALLGHDSEYTIKQWWIYIQPWNNVLFFISGIIIGWTSQKLNIQNNKNFWWPIVLLLIAFCVYPAKGQLIEIMSGLNRLAFTAICIALCFCVFNLSLNEGTAVGRFLKTLGDLSYALYMFHGVIGEITLKIIAPALGIYDLELKFILMFLVAIPLTVGASYAFYMFVEKPAMKLGRRLIGSYKTKPQAECKPS